ncbi:hypothetical protein ACS0TY_028328 [Phlomoides rotata]
MEETLNERGKSFAAIVVFVIVFLLHFVTKYLESHKRKKGPDGNLDVELREQIKQLLKEASSLSQPSTFAQAAKLRRMAAAKEKELAKYLEMQKKEMSFGSCEKLIMISKIVSYIVLIIWFWKIPVTTISDQLVQPFGKLLSWRSGRSLKDHVVVMTLFPSFLHPN